MAKKKKPKSNFINMLLTLTLIAIISGFALGSVYVATKEPIAKAKKEKLEKAIGLVLPQFDTVKHIEVQPVGGGKEMLDFYQGYKAGEMVGTAVKTYTNKGFGGKVEIMVGFDNDLNIINTQVLKHAETPGLGDKMSKSKSDWTNQFNNKNPKDFRLKVKKDGGDVDAITAATISSRAFCDAVNRAYNTINEKGGKK